MSPVWACAGDLSECDLYGSVVERKGSKRTGVANGFCTTSAIFPLSLWADRASGKMPECPLDWPNVVLTKQSCYCRGFFVLFCF